MTVAKPVFLRLLAAACLLALPVAQADIGSNKMTASEKISIGTMSIIVAPAASHGAEGVGASVVLTGAGASYLVTGLVEGAGDTVEVILSAVGAAGKLSVKLSGKAVNGIGLSVGKTVTVLSETTGTILVASGKVVAFIPNEIGKALLAQSRVPEN